MYKNKKEPFHSESHEKAPFFRACLCHRKYNSFYPNLNISGQNTFDLRPLFCNTPFL